MKKITTVLALFVLAIFATSCNNESTIQEYLVKSQEKEGFMTIDIPVNFIKPKSLDVPTDVQETINSIRKVNLVALPYQGNEDTYQSEKDKLTKILKSDKYKSLMRMNAQGIKMSIYYTGSSDAIDEVIAFGYAKDKGVGVARILGNDMDPSKIITMMNNITLDSGQLNLKKFNLAF
ncbi:DUF4252 domain-containing protein [Pseudotenacibaculum sp. MALMAid0570]|uniref:DUF4252 domain-containing protein n=1 Tax=Pseudotenacibaculum sp. MALMAid0570 TaxID=3143938 RepID=UPI0032DF241B